MKKMTFKSRLFGSVCCLSAALLAVSCAQGVDDETYSAGVTNQQLASPAADAITFSYVTDASGNEQVKVEWPVAMGAGGYECAVENVNDPANPETVVDNKVVDGCSLLFPSAEDTNYSVSVKTLGNEKLNNTGAESATVVAFSTMIDGVAVPEGTELGAFISQYIADNAADLAAKRAADPNFEIAFDLAAGATYALDTKADFDIQPTRLRGNMADRPQVVIGENGGLVTAAGLKVKNTNFDAAAMKQRGLITMKKDPDESIAGPNGYVVEKPIRLEACWVKELTRSSINCDVSAYGVKEFRISDCIIQLNMDGSDQWLTFINMWQNKGRFLGQDGKCWYGAALNTIVVNSTIYNRYDPSKMKDKAYFIRFANQAIDKVFGSYNGTFDIKNSTLCRMMPNKDFGNNIANKPAYVITFSESIFYDTYRLQKVKRGGTYNWSKNYIWGVTKSVDGTDKKEIATEADPGFTRDNLDKALDFSQPNGGGNFTPTGEAASAGDPRWINQ